MQPAQKSLAPPYTKPSFWVYLLCDRREQGRRIRSREYRGAGGFRTVHINSRDHNGAIDSDMTRTTLNDMRPGETRHYSAGYAGAIGYPDSRRRGHDQHGRYGYLRR